MTLPDELTPTEQGLLETALLELETHNAVRLKDAHWSPEVRANMEDDMHAARTLREKLRTVYLVPMARQWQAKGVAL